MKCPYRIDEVNTYHDGKTWIYRDFADCYGEICPYFDAYPMGSCRKVANEKGYYTNQEVD